MEVLKYFIIEYYTFDIKSIYNLCPSNSKHENLPWENNLEPSPP